MATAGTSVAISVEHTPRPGLCGLMVLSGDMVAVAFAIAAAVLVRHMFGGRYEFTLYWRLAGMLVLFAAGYSLFGLYPGISRNAVREFRQLTLATTLVFVVLGFLTFLFKEGVTYSRLVFAIAWVGALIAVPLTRAGMRRALGRCSWWGYPVAVFGSGDVARELVRNLRAQPEGGLHPVAMFRDHGSTSAPEAEVPVLGDPDSAPSHALRLGLKHAVIAIPDMSAQQIGRLMENCADTFSHVYVVAGLTGLSTIGVEASDVGSMLALEVRQSLLLPGAQFIKRMLDQCLSLLCGLILLPAMVLIALAIRLESPGGIWYKQRRIGWGGQPFHMWKFRTMYGDGDRILEQYLREHAEERIEWRDNRKLRRDPRVTRVGRLLRRTSLDELPQLWNVLRGEMSMVGPRPIVRDEVPRYGDSFTLYCRVKPGLTGLWQVSGRSDTDYDERVELDIFYVRNWSPWFDIYLLARTVRTVLSGEGAY